VRSGHGPDVYFQDMVKENKQTQERVESLAKKDQEEYINRAKKRMKGAPKEDYKPSFKPTGPQLYKEL